MTREEKAVVIDELKDKFANNAYFYVLDAGGMTVAETNNFRKKCFDSKFEYKVVKNSLIKKALEAQEADYTEFNEKVLKGFSGVLFSPDSGSTPAKMLKDFRKKAEKPLLKGASIDASFFYGDDSIDALTKVKSKADVLAELVGLLQSPGQSLARALQSPGQNLVGALQDGNNKLTGILKALENKQS